MLTWLQRDPEDPSLWSDLINGRAGWVPRMGISLAIAGGLFALMFGMMGLVDLSIGLDDHHVAIGIAMAGVTWCAALVFIWATFGKWQKSLKTCFCILGVWIVAIPMAIFVGETVKSEEFFIAAILAMATGISLFLLMTLGYRRSSGKAIILRDGVIDVRCPDCGYSLVGLSECICPECGSAMTIDELIRRQNYKSLALQLPEELEPELGLVETSIEPPLALPDVEPTTP